MNPFEFFQTASVPGAIETYTREPAAQYIAGGTNLLDLMKYRVALPATVIDINALPGLQQIEPLSNGNLRLGALVSNAATAYHPLVENNFPLLARAILAGASAQIRNMATNGGNLLQRTRCYYFYDVHTPCNKRQPGTGCSAVNGYNRMMAVVGSSEHCIAVFPSDMCVALAALDAVVEVQGANGNREIPFLSFHRLPGDTPHIDNTLQAEEIITGILLPANTFQQYYNYLKLRDRNSYAFALVSVASTFTIEHNAITGARIALGGVAHKPWRVPAAESFLLGKEPVRANFEQAADIIMQGAKGYQYNHFKIALAKKAIVRSCLMALEPSLQLPGAAPSA